MKTMLTKFSKYLYLSLLVSLMASCTEHKEISLKQSFDGVLLQLDSTLISLQNIDTLNPDHGALWCPHCSLYHTRGAEAVYPLAYEFLLTKDIKYRDAVINLGNWLIRQQFPDGSWKETPEEWTGTSTDQLLMMAQAYTILKPHLSVVENQQWLNAMTKAGDYLTQVMTPEFASINYVSTTTATLAVLNTVIPDNKYSEKARTLAHQVIAKMDDDYFITGEGGRVFDAKYGVDLAYNMEMSLWGLLLYSNLSNDDLVKGKVLEAAKRHLFFIYPDGSLDGSWGIRSNKWTCFGGATSDGTQVLFSLLADYDDAYRTAALRNLNYLKGCINKGFVGYGPQHWEIMSDGPCIYPTFAKAKNLAMAHAFLKNDNGIFPSLPSDKNGLNVFPTLNIATVRTDNFYATITAYGYKDPKGSKSKYMYRPTGGAISNLWLKDYGFLQASSQTEYHRWEPMHFPEANSLKSLTPRIEFSNGNGYFTNLFEFDATTNYSQNGNIITAKIIGELKNRKQEEGGIGYSYSYTFTSSDIVKQIHIRYHDILDTVQIIEPIIQYKDVEIVKVDEKTALIKSTKRTIRFELQSGNTSITLGYNAKDYWSPYPALKAFPIILTLTPSKDKIEEDIVYRFTIVR